MDPLAVYAAYLVQALELWDGTMSSPGAPARIRSRLRSELCLLGHDFGFAASAGESLVRRLAK
jgi:hypothetical protein